MLRVVPRRFLATMRTRYAAALQQPGERHADGDVANPTAFRWPSSTRSALVPCTEYQVGRAPRVDDAGHGRGLVPTSSAGPVRASGGPAVLKTRSAPMLVPDAFHCATSGSGRRRRSGQARHAGGDVRGLRAAAAVSDRGRAQAVVGRMKVRRGRRPFGFTEPRSVAPPVVTDETEPVAGRRARGGERAGRAAARRVAGRDER